VGEKLLFISVCFAGKRNTTVMKERMKEMKYFLSELAGSLFSNAGFRLN
jgi:hypothetical protein